MKTLCAQDARKRFMMKNIYLQNEKLGDIQNKYNTNYPNEVCNEGLSKERMIKIAKFIDEKEIEKKI